MYVIKDGFGTEFQVFNFYIINDFLYFNGNVLINSKRCNIIFI